MADHLRPLAVTRLLTAIYAQDGRRCREGYRPPMGALDAVEKLTIQRPCGRYNWVVEADLQGGFATIAHVWMMRLWAERIEDRALRRLIKTWLKAGRLDTDGQGWHPVAGTPPGGIVSPPLGAGVPARGPGLVVRKGGPAPGSREAGLIRDADASCVPGRDRQRPHASTPGEASDWDRSGWSSQPRRRGSCPAAGNPQPRRPALSGWASSVAGTRTGQGTPMSHADRPQEAPKLPEAVHPMVSGAPQPAAGGPVCAAPGQAARGLSRTAYPATRPGSSRASPKPWGS